MLMNKQSDLEQNFGVSTCDCMCRVEFITGVHSRLGEFWNLLISELAINVNASTFIFLQSFLCFQSCLAQ